MERKYTVVLCCIALLFLGSMCFGVTTNWAKHNIASFTGMHLYFNAPNASGPNGEGDSAMVNYFTGEFTSADTVLGVNIECYDWNAGSLGLTFKALEMRYGNTGITGAADWTNAGLINYGLANEAAIAPAPYLSTWPSLHQYTFPAQFQLGAAAAGTVVTTCQYTPGQNVVSPGCPLVGIDNGPAAGSWGWDALNQTSSGYTVNWLLCPFGIPGIPDVYPDFTLLSRKYSVSCEETALVKGQGVSFVVHLVNSTGGFVSTEISVWVRNNILFYQGFTGTGVDFISNLTGGASTNPITLNVPPISYTVPVPFNANLGNLMDFGFSAFTFEAIMASAVGNAFYESWSKDLMLTPVGCQDDNGPDIYWAIQTPPVQGDMMTKRFRKTIMPSGAFTLTDIDWSPSNFSGNTNALALCEIRWESTVYGDGTPDMGTGGLLGTFDPASVPIGTLYRAAVYDTIGNSGIGFAAGPNNVYAGWWYNYVTPANDVYVGSDLQGPDHKRELRDSGWTTGSGVGPNVPFNGTADLCIVRMVTTEGLDSNFNGGVTRAANISEGPTCGKF